MYEQFQVRSAYSQPRVLTKISGRDQAPAALATATDFATRWIGRWVGSRADLDALEGDKFLAPV